MPRPRHQRQIGFEPEVKFFKPRGIPLRELEIAELTQEEAEALRLKYVLNLEQIQAADRMHTSQSTFQRILSSATRKVADAVINGKAIRIN